jgi:Tfp pilus assembly protein PilE
VIAMNNQRGLTFISLVAMIAGIVFIAVIGIKLWPAYTEYFAVKKAFASLKTQMAGAEMNKKDIVNAFDRQATIDDIKSIKGSDLVVESSDSGMAVSVEYSVVTPLFANVSALVDFSLSTDESASSAAGAKHSAE